MKKIYLLTILLATCLSFGQVSILSLNATYSENFDIMGSTGTTLPANWTGIRFSGTGTLGAVLIPIVTDGSSNTGGINNIGTTASSERALGVLSSNSTIPAIGVSFVNNTGDKITEFNLTTMVEQWRTGDNIVVENMAFAYSTDATGLNSGTWTTVTSLDANEILTTSILATAVDGNALANRTSISSTVNISATPWLTGTTFWIRWVDANAAGADSTLAIDDFTFKGTSNVLSTKQNSISGLRVYPNPAKNNLFISSDNNEVKQVEIYNVLGKVVLNTKVTNAPINISAISSGVYVVKITEAGKTATRKLVVE